MQRWMLLGITAVFGCFVVGIIVIADQAFGPQVFHWIYRIPGGDKTGHAVLMGTLAFLVNLCLNDRRWQLGSLRVQQGSLIVLALVVAEECSQLWIAHRTFDGLDLLSDLVGISIGGMVARRLVNHWHTQASQNYGKGA